MLPLVSHGQILFSYVHSHAYSHMFAKIWLQSVQPFDHLSQILNFDPMKPPKIPPMGIAGLFF